jgi:hypothetical protein
VHIDNPLLHAGLEDARSCPAKTDNAVINHWQIWKTQKLSEKELKENKLYMKMFFSPLKKKNGERRACPSHPYVKFFNRQKDTKKTYSGPDQIPS